MQCERKYSREIQIKKRYKNYTKNPFLLGGREQLATRRSGHVVFCIAVTYMLKKMNELTKGDIT